MDQTYLPYLVTELFCVFFALDILARLKHGVGTGKEIRTLEMLIVLYIIMAATDIFCVSMERGVIRFLRPADAVSNAVSNCAVVLGCYCWFQFIEIRLGNVIPERKKLQYLLLIPIGILCILNLCSAATGWIFFVDDSGHYEEGHLFWIQAVVTFAYLWIPTLHSLYRALRTTSQTRRKEYLTYVAYIIIPTGLVWITDSFLTIPLFALSCYGVIQILFLTLYLDQEYKMAAVERERTRSNIDLIMNQLKPHFLFNALMAIQALCHGKAPDAEEATVEFAEYLRGNIDSLRRLEPVPFEQELLHTRNYLLLENKRFSGKIRVKYDLQTTDFQLPALTLQTAVENAVRCGVTQRVEGGTIQISTRDTGRSIILTVLDDGIGFDPASLKPEDRLYNKFDNLRSRLANVSEGTLDIQSAPEKGTKLVIKIPKRRA